MSPIFPTAVYSLCFLTSAVCALLLGRSYFKTRARVRLASCRSNEFLALKHI